MRDRYGKINVISLFRRYQLAVFIFSKCHLVRIPWMTRTPLEGPPTPPSKQCTVRINWVFLLAMLIVSSQ